MRNRRTTALQIFDDYMRLENRMPTRSEFNLSFYGKTDVNSNYYYGARKKWLAEQENPEQFESEKVKLVKEYFSDIKTLEGILNETNGIR